MSLISCSRDVQGLFDEEDDADAQWMDWNRSSCAKGRAAAALRKLSRFLAISTSDDDLKGQKTRLAQPCPAQKELVRSAQDWKVRCVLVKRRRWVKKFSKEVCSLEKRRLGCLGSYCCQRSRGDNSQARQESMCCGRREDVVAATESRD